MTAAHHITRWQTRAACAELGMADVSDNAYEQRPSATRQMKAVCAVCPVANRCLEWALDNEPDYGVWGGMTGSERARLPRRTGVRRR